MSNSPEIQKLLDDIENLTGLRLSLEAAGDREPDESETADRLRKLLFRLEGGEASASGSKEQLLKRLLRGELAADELTVEAARAHLKPNELRSAILVRFDKPYGDAERSILGEWLVAGRDVLIGMDDRDMVVVRSYDEHPSDIQLTEEAEAIEELLTAEAAVSVIVAYDAVCDDISGLKRVYKHCLTAAESGGLFRYYNTGRVIGYRTLNLERLVLELSEEACASYLKDHFGDFDLATLSNEDLATLKALFENGLSVAETARALYIHRNSLVYRLDRIQKLSGYDVRVFSEATTFKLGLLMTARLSNINS